jgi:hypothetical protein
MSDQAKVPLFRLSTKARSSENGNGRKSHLISTADVAPGEERKVNLKRAFFFLAVAFLLIFASQLSRVGETPDSSSTRAFGRGITVSLSPRRDGGNQIGLVVQFQLRNMGNRSLFYPARPGTSAPLGQIVSRASGSSEWMTPSGTLKPQGAALQEFINPNLAWIEMPPGGWVDGAFHDPEEFPESHAYAIYVKPDRNADEVLIVSEPYRFDRN